ncbi:MAG TPA: hypothetical protein VIH47_06000 [Solirubrobacterales bacterium]
MKTGGPVERVETTLKQVGYEAVEQPKIAGISFDFAAMLAGHASLDLVVVVDLALEADEARIRRRVEALARALDLVRSRRSLTVVLVGPRPDPALIQAIAVVARVLGVSPGEDADTSLRDALAVLLPLEIDSEEEKDAGADWEDTRQRLLKEHSPEVDSVLEAARRGEEAVTEALRGVLAQPLEELEEADYGEDGEE